MDCLLSTPGGPGYSIASPYTGGAMTNLAPLLAWIGGLLAFFCLLASFRNFRRRRLSEALPTSRALSVFMGLVEMKGSAECEQPLRSYLTELECVYYEWLVEEEWERTRTDSEGKREFSGGWLAVGGASAAVPFYVKDATGAVLVQPQGAAMDGAVVFSRTCKSDDYLYYAKGPRPGVSNSRGLRRFTEKAILLHGPVYVVGKARERKDAVAAEIAEDKFAPLFLISGRSEKEVQSSYFRGGVTWTLIGLVLLVGGFVWSDRLQQLYLIEQLPLYFSVASAYLGVWVLAWVWNVFNDLIGLRNRVREGWALIDVQLKRRHDLIPNLVRIVSALRDHEHLVQEQLAALRAQGTAGVGPRALKPALLAVQEKYPVLKAMPAFLDLQKSLVETEERIALARDYYNNISMHFNTRIEQVPANFVRMLTAMRRFEPLSAQDFERAAVKISFTKFLPIAARGTT